MRLQRTGTTKRPAYRLVVIDKARANKGGIIENLGMVDLLGKETVHKIDEGRVIAWIQKGAAPSETAKGVLKKAGIWAKLPKPAPKAAKPPKAKK